MKNEFWGKNFSADLVSSEPDIMVEKIEKNDAFVVIACDGLWDVISSQECVELVKEKICEQEDCSGESLAESLVQFAIDRGSLDNISLIIVFLKPLSLLKMLFKESHKKRGSKNLLINRKKQKQEKEKELFHSENVTNATSI